MTGIIEDVLAAMSDSPLIDAATSLRHRLSVPGYPEFRPLQNAEIVQLEQQGNRCGDWSLVQVGNGFKPDFIWDNRFQGVVVLGSYSGGQRELPDNVRLPTGLYNSTFCDVDLGDEVLVHRVGLVNRVWVESRASLVQCSTISCDEPATFGCGDSLHLGVETGERDVRKFAELTVELAERLSYSLADAHLREDYDGLIDDYLTKIQSSRTVIGPGAIVMNTRRLVSSLVGPGAVIHNATCVARSAIVSTEEQAVYVGDGVCLRDSVAQWNVRLDSGALVDNSLLCESAKVQRQAKVSGSLIGPNTEVEQGEITASLVGPFVGFHHQALLIAASWPAGKGNIGHGAKIGSNHTGRAPDQEFRGGEGVFFGLGTMIKFPFDCSGSPYSIFAAGVVCPPQKLSFPFSLIKFSDSSENAEFSSQRVLRGNEILPGWVLQHNAYALKRAEKKFRERDRTLRAQINSAILRPDIVDAMRDALQRLTVAGGQASYTAGDLPGLGGNVLTEKSRLGAISTYGNWIDYYALEGLRLQLLERSLPAEAPEAAALLQIVSDEESWEHQRQILIERQLVCEIPVLLEQLVRLAKGIAEGVERSRERDERRGQEIMPDYTQTHRPVADDPVVRQVWDEFYLLECSVRKMLAS
jgi:hypothetical protein